MSYHHSLIQAAAGERMMLAKGLGKAASDLLYAMNSRSKAVEIKSLQDRCEHEERFPTQAELESLGKQGDPGEAATFLIDVLTAEAVLVLDEADVLVVAHPDAFQGDDATLLAIAREGLSARVPARVWNELVDSTRHAREIWEETYRGLRKDSFDALPKRVVQSKDRLRLACESIVSAQTAQNEACRAIVKKQSEERQKLMQDKLDELQCQLREALSKEAVDVAPAAPVEPSAPAADPIEAIGCQPARSSEELDAIASTVAAA